MYLIFSQLCNVIKFALNPYIIYVALMILFYFFKL